MKRTILLSLATVISLYAKEIELAPIGVESTQITDVAQNAQTSADVAQALEDNIPSVDISRRSAIANDVFIRGQKRDNISVTVDGTKTYGACPNRMDPPISHVLASQIESIEVIEGPYDVENFGVLSGGLKIHTKQPSKKAKAQVNLGFGSWNYKKFGLTASGGNDFARFLITGSMQSSDQYHDGSGNTMTQQTAKKTPNSNHYKTQYEDIEAYTKNSMNTKAFINTADKQQLRLSYTANRSKNVIYPNTSMDAIIDNSDIYSIEYNIKDINNIYKNLNLQYYYSKVDHPMSTQFRNNTLDKTNHLRTSMQGVKIKNNLDINTYNALLGIDTSKRIWGGAYYKTSTGKYLANSISNTQTDNFAIFGKIDKSYKKVNLSAGARYDVSTIKNGGGLQSNDYNSLGANITATYNIDENSKVYLGFGKASRVPDARELYFLKKGKVLGTPDLDQVTNREMDLGYNTNNEFMELKIKTFYSKIKNYIYVQNNIAQHIFKNIDATIYGAEISGSIYATDDITVDFGSAYKRGTKDSALSGQSNKNLADMAPLKANIALNYEYQNNSLATLELKASQRWSRYDSDNGEQEIAGWAIVNMKIKQQINKKFDFSIGVNNALNKTYATSNTYADLTLLGTSTGEKMLLNEPGRYIYTNLDFKF